ncbi:FAD binding domain-containing protein [Bdellovibrio sp. HCB337]|uniref:FAD binding domain-containing protein n=1 Tax=Bdellovibrio sp. HCB337 TaxID=3394358 RepID=UPI0039A5A3EE
MRAFVPEYEMKTPENLEEVISILSKQPNEWKLFAGGTDLMVVFETGKLKQKKFLNINSIPELKSLVSNEEDILIGAGCTYSQIQNHPIIKKEFPLMVHSAKVTGAVAIQNRGTIGGNIANMSPAADTPPSLLAYDADIILLSTKGYRVLSYKYFHQAYKQADLRPNEIIMAVRLKREQNITHDYYRKVGTRSAQAISKVCMAATASVNRGKIEWVRIGLGSVGPIPLRPTKTEHFLFQKELTFDNIKEARKMLLTEITPIDDIRSEAMYRREVAGNLLTEFLESLKS